MAQNDFKPFAIGSGANVTSQADWEALSALVTGFQSGKASSAQVNKAIRQASFISAALAQFVSDKKGADVLDDGDPPGFVTDFISAVAVQSLTRANPFADIKADGTVNTALANLGLTEIPGRLLGVQRFTTSGTYTPSSGVKKIIVEVLGGGGGGGGAQAGTGFASFGAGAAAGSYAKGLFTDLLSSYVVTIGAGGKGGGGTENGSPGGTTSLGSLISVSGGNPGQTAAAGTDPYIMGSLGSPGTVVGGNVISNPSQNTGGFGFRLSATVCSGGTGSDSIYGRGGDAASSTNRVGRSATGYGAGGGGGRAVSQSGTPYIGGDGSDGIVIIWEFA